MAKQHSNFWRMFATLSIITIIAAGALGFVNKWTAEPIREAMLAKQMQAINLVAGDFSNDPVADSYAVYAEELKDSLLVFPLNENGEPNGVVVKSYSPRGYSGNVWLMVGFDPNGTITGSFVLDHKETPGLGSKMSDPDFYRQFEGKDPATTNLKVAKDGGEVDAISGATISSQAYSDAILTAFEIFKETQHGTAKN